MNLSLLDQMPCNWFQQQTEYTCSVEGLPHSCLLSSLTTLQNQIFICDTGGIFLWGSAQSDISMVALFSFVFTPQFLVSLVGQRILKVDRESGVCSNFQFSNFGVLGLPYWLKSPLETFYTM